MVLYLPQIRLSSVNLQTYLNQITTNLAMRNMDVVEINRVAVESDDLEQTSPTKLSNNGNLTATQGK